MGAWLAIGLVCGALLAPAAVYGAATLTQIVGTNGTTVAQVDQAHQLLTTEIAPASVVTASGTVNSSTCELLYTIPAGKALILKAAFFYLSSSASSGTGGEADLYSNAACSTPIDVTGTVPTGGTSTIPLNLGVGWPIPAKTVLYAKAFAAIGTVAINGYLVGSASVPATALPTGGRAPRVAG